MEDNRDWYQSQMPLSPSSSSNDLKEEDEPEGSGGSGASSVSQELETELGNLNLQMRNKDNEEDPASSKALPGERIQFQMTLHDEEGGLDDATSAKGN